MTPPGFDYPDAIAGHADGFARAARGNLDAPVEHCPGWSVGDLVAHLTDVHWFWGTIVAERLSEPPAEERRPPRAPAGELVDVFERGADHMVGVFRGAEPSAAVWTWAPARQDAGFVIRHQVQEAVVHHFDAASAAGAPVTIAPEIGVDSIDEFLTFSVSSAADPADPPRPALDGAFVLACTDAPDAWTVTDGPAPGTVAFEPSARARTPAVRARASDLLLWLYGRAVLDESAVEPEVVARFRGLCFTD